MHSNTLYCDLCGGEFKSKEKLRVHKINKHLEDHEKPYVCSICGKGYAHKVRLILKSNFCRGRKLFEN